MANLARLPTDPAAVAAKEGRTIDVDELRGSVQEQVRVPKGVR